VRQQLQPFARQGVDLGGGKAVADRLQTLRLGTAENAIVERFESDAFLRELALGVFRAVQAQLGNPGIYTLRYIRSVPSTVTSHDGLTISATLCAIIPPAPVGQVLPL